MGAPLKESAGMNIGDVTNPFIAKVAMSPSSKRSVSPADDGISLLREGVARMDIASRTAGAELASAVSRESTTSGRDRDRFVPSRPASLHHASHSSTTLPTLALDTSDSSMDSSMRADTSTASLSAALGIPSSKQRILSFRAAPPLASHATSHLDAQRNYLLHTTGAASRGTGTGGPGQSSGTKKRTPPYVADRVLDAPGFADDYYLNLMDWSASNQVAIGLGDLAYVWNAEEGSVTALGEDNEDQVAVTAVSWSADGAYLAVGTDAGQIEIYDVDEKKRLRVMSGHNARVPTLSWNGHILSSGCRDGSIHHHDLRLARHKVMELHGHNAEVCGLAWRSDGQLLASGGNDNVVNCWDGRIGQSVLQQGDEVPRGVSKWTKRNHTAAVKALAWCPWQQNLLATGGGSHDQHIHFWSSNTGARTASLHTATQVTSLIWSPHAKELLSTHGFPNNNICLWSYPSLSKIYDLPAHDSRILASSLSPDGCDVATAASDENLKFWKIWEQKTTKKADEHERDARGKMKTGMMIR